MTAMSFSIATTNTLDDGAFLQVAAGKDSSSMAAKSSRWDYKKQQSKPFVLPMRCRRPFGLRGVSRVEVSGVRKP